MENIKEGSPATALLSKTSRWAFGTFNETKLTRLSLEANFQRHPEVSTLSKVKLVRYQQNPTANWGPGAKAQSAGKKRKRQEGEENHKEP